MPNRCLKLLTGFLLLAAAQQAPAQCRLCAPGGGGPVKPPPAPIAIEVEAGIDFSRLALITAGQGGTATLDAATGARTITGSLVDLRGMPIQGSVLIRGERNQPVQVVFPGSATLSTTGGGTIQLTGLSTTLKANPRTGQDGTLRFSFGGRLMIDGSSHGDFRGTIPITVEYR